MFLMIGLLEFRIDSYVVMMPKKRQALVEYEDMNGSCNAVTYAADNQVYIAGHPAFINYSTSQKISRPGDSDDTRSVNNVLLLTIINPIYPITTVTRNTEKPFIGSVTVDGSDLYIVKCTLIIVLRLFCDISVQDVLYTICNNCGPVQRIVIFRKNGVQAMVEYPFSFTLDCLTQGC